MDVPLLGGSVPVDGGDTQRVRTLVVADDPLARAGLAAMLDERRRLHVVGRASGDAQLLADVDVYRPDAVVWDLGWEQALTDSRGSPTAPRPLVELLDTGMPAVFMLDSPDSATSIWAVGGRSLLLRSASAPAIERAIRATLEGLVVLDPSLASGLVPTLHPPEAPPAEALTARELEVLRLLAEGYANKAIALRLGVSEHTVKFHVTAIMTKLNAQSRTEAVVRATRLGLITL
jgi:DNA-binding NarL/FixJ family response regulator